MRPAAERRRDLALRIGAPQWTYDGPYANSFKAAIARFAYAMSRLYDATADAMPGWLELIRGVLTRQAEAMREQWREGP